MAKRLGYCLLPGILIIMMLLSACEPETTDPDPSMDDLSYDLVIQGGTVIDGTGAPGMPADVGIKDGKIIAVGELNATRADKVIEASGLVVAPGFIDIHTHCESGLADFSTKENLNYLHMGVTTVKAGSCGVSPFPIELNVSIYELQGVGTNVTLLVGHNTIRPSDAHPATDSEISSMQDMVRQAMEDGAWGMSTGLIYTPGIFSTTEEIIELSRVVAEYGGIYDTHMRCEEENVLSSVEETISIAEAAGLPANISHIKALGPAQWGLSEEMISMIDEARERGLDITADVYPYTAAATSISILFPDWSREGGIAGLEARINDPRQRPLVKEGAMEGIISMAGDDISRIVAGGINLEQRCIDEGLEPTVANAAEIIMDLSARTPAIYHSMSEEDLINFLQHPHIAISSDGRTDGTDHPRSYGTFPRALGVYVREKQVLTLEEAVRKMTALPAEILRLEKRGQIAEGYWADITIFNPDTIIDTADFDDPRTYPIGIDYVIVNGVPSIANGDFTGDIGGVPLYGPGKK